VPVVINLSYRDREIFCVSKKQQQKKVLGNKFKLGMVVDHTKYFKKKEERYFALGMKATMLLRYFMKFSTYSKLLQVDSMPLDRRNIPLRFALTTFSPKRKTD
jgi:hypothetical protein